MKVFYILDHPLLPTPYNHRFFVEKFASGFELNHYRVQVVNSIEDITEPGFVMVSNHPFFYSLGKRGLNNSLLRKIFLAAEKYLPGNPLGRLASCLHKRVMRSLAVQAKKNPVVIIAWFWHEQEKFVDSLGVPVIFTGEYLYSRPESPYHQKWMDFYERKSNALPIRFSAKIDPMQDGKDCENQKILVSFVGNRHYKPEWYQLSSHRKSCKIVPTPPYISEEERLNIFKNSQINLGLHSDANIRSGVVVERIFEALAYGALCFSDNPNAVPATEGCAVLVKDKEELENLVELYVNDPEKRRALRKKGFDFVRTRGTNYHRAQEFIALKEKLFPTYGKVQ